MVRRGSNSVLARAPFIAESPREMSSATQTGLALRCACQNVGGQGCSSAGEGDNLSHLPDKRGELARDGHAGYRSTFATRDQLSIPGA